MIHVAIIGTGAISDSHIAGYCTFPERCKITALVDIDVSKAEKKIADHKLQGVVALQNLEDLLALPERPELVSICLPPALHCEVAVTLLEAGVSVLCEKPLAPTLEGW